MNDKEALQWRMQSQRLGSLVRGRVRPVVHFWKYDTSMETAAQYARYCAPGSGPDRWGARRAWWRVITRIQDVWLKRAQPGPSWNPLEVKIDTKLNPDSVWAVNRVISEEVEERCFPFGYTHAVLDELLRDCAVDAFLRRRKRRKVRR